MRQNRVIEYLIDVYPLKVDLHNRGGCVCGILDMSELSVARVDVDDGHDGRALPFVAPAAVEVRSGPFNRSGILISAYNCIKTCEKIHVTKKPRVS